MPLGPVAVFPQYSLSLKAGRENREVRSGSASACSHSLPPPAPRFAYETDIVLDGSEDCSTCIDVVGCVS